MPTWLVKIPALIRAYGPFAAQVIVAAREAYRRWRQKGK